MYKTVCLTTLMRERTTIPWSIVNDIIKLKTMAEYKTINLKLLIVCIETIYFKFMAKYAYIYIFKYLSVFETLIASFALLRESGRSSVLVWCSLRLSDWWNFLYSIMGNVVFNQSFCCKSQLVKTQVETDGFNKSSFVFKDLGPCTPFVWFSAFSHP